LRRRSSAEKTGKEIEFLAGGLCVRRGEIFLVGQEEGADGHAAFVGGRLIKDAGDDRARETGSGGNKCVSGLARACGFLRSYAAADHAHFGRRGYVDRGSEPLH